MISLFARNDKSCIETPIIAKPGEVLNVSFDFSACFSDSLGGGHILDSIDCDDGLTTQRESFDKSVAYFQIVPTTIGRKRMDVVIKAYEGEEIIQRSVIVRVVR